MLIHGFVRIKTWVLISCGTGIYVIIWIKGSVSLRFSHEQNMHKGLYVWYLPQHFIHHFSDVTSNFVWLLSDEMKLDLIITSEHSYPFGHESMFLDNVVWMIPSVNCWHYSLQLIPILFELIKLMSESNNTDFSKVLSFQTFLSNDAFPVGANWSEGSLFAMAIVLFISLLKLHLKF